MDEFLYLSRNKLKQFSLRPGRLEKTAVSLKLSLPILGIEASGSSKDDVDAKTLRDLSRVQSNLIRRGRNLIWFEDLKVTNGDWIQFEAPLSLTSINVPDWSISLFTSRPHPGDDEVHLLLHGSTSNIIGRGGEHTGNEVSDASFADGLRRTLTYLKKSGEVAHDEHRTAADSADFDLANLYRSTVDQALSFSWMEGWARVTRICKNEVNSGRLLVATPLYIRMMSDGET